MSDQAADSPASRTRVVIPFVRVDASQNPNAARVGTDAQQAGYARAAAVTLASLRRWNPQVQLTWLTNGAVHPLLADLTSQLEVEVVQTPFTHEPPDGYMSAFKGCLYLLDALQRFQGESVLYLDPDVLCVRSLQPMLDELGEQVGALPMNFPPGEVVNGVDHDVAAQVHAAIGGHHGFGGFVGGEAVWVPASAAADVARRMDAAHGRSLELFAAGSSHFGTEEHLLSSVLSDLPSASLLPWVRRIWTTASYRTVDGHEDALSLWHLPSEKDYGFRVMYDDAANPASWFWTAQGPEFRQVASRMMSLSGRPPLRVARDTVGAAVRAANRGRQVRRPRFPRLASR